MQKEITDYKANAEMKAFEREAAQQAAVQSATNRGGRFQPICGDSVSRGRRGFATKRLAEGSSRRGGL
jgi:hypothetical protein